MNLILASVVLHERKMIFGGRKTISQQALFNKKSKYNKKSVI
jgi:hypothetical protein